MVTSVLIASALLIGFYAVSYAAFDVCLSDDVEFRYGKGRVKKRRKNAAGWWRRFLFFDIRKEVIPWHYVMFWEHLASSAAAILALDVHIICGDQASRLVFLLSEGIALFSCAVILCVRWKLYAGNKVRNRKEYRKKDLQT